MQRKGLGNQCPKKEMDENTATYTWWIRSRNSVKVQLFCGNPVKRVSTWALTYNLVKKKQKQILGPFFRPLSKEPETQSYRHSFLNFLNGKLSWKENYCIVYERVCTMHFKSMFAKSNLSRSFYQCLIDNH